MPKGSKDRRATTSATSNEGEKINMAVSGPLLRAGNGAISHWCPGCEEVHATPVPRWAFNGDSAKPTFTPSVKISWGDKPGARVCHYNITNGSIFFHGDTTHKRAGQTVPLPPIPPDE